MTLREACCEALRRRGFSEETIQSVSIDAIGPNIGQKITPGGEEAEIDRIVVVLDRVMRLDRASVEHLVNTLDEIDKIVVRRQ